MLIRIKSFNGFTLNDSNYAAAGLRLKSPPDAKLVYVEQAKADAIYSGMYNINVRSVPVGIKILDMSSQPELEAELKDALRPGTEGVLVGTFTDDSQDYEMDCVVQSIMADDKYDGYWQVIFQTGDSAWRRTAYTTASWDITASGDTKEITVGGYADTMLGMTLTTTSLPATGYAYQRLYQLINAVGYNYGWRPWCISLDTAALVTAGKMQADGDDIRLVIDGKLQRRWLADINTDHTKIWFNVKLKDGLALTLRDAIGSGDTITEIRFEKTDDNREAFNKLPERGFLVHGTEWIEYTGKDKNLTITGVTRSAFETTAQAHSVHDTFNWIEHSIFLLYGNSAAAAPSTGVAAYDDTKPLFDLSSSSNTQWVYSATSLFSLESKPNRTGGWKKTISKVGNQSELYDVKGDATSGDPAMGMHISTWVRNGNNKAETATLAWSMTHAGGIQEVSTTARKYRSTAAWPATAAIQLQYLKNSRKWVQVWTSATPSSEDTWEDITKASEAVSPASEQVRYVLSGTLAAAADVDDYFEVLTSTVVFVSANEPTGSLGSELSNYLLDVSFVNQNNDDQIDLSFPLRLNKNLVINPEDLLMTYAGVNAFGALSLDDESRDVWMRLEPGTNTIEVTGNDVGLMTATLRWKERRL